MIKDVVSGVNVALGSQPCASTWWHDAGEQPHLLNEPLNGVINGFHLLRLHSVS